MFFSKRFVVACAVILFAFIMGSYWAAFKTIAWLLVLAVVVLTLADIIALYSRVGAIRNNVKGKKKRQLVTAERIVSERLSNGDDNAVVLKIKSFYKFRISAIVYDEIPDEFQLFDFHQNVVLQPSKEIQIEYTLHPVERGLLTFGNINVLVYSPLHLIERRFVSKCPCEVKVYPAYLFIRNRQLMSVENRDNDMGVKHVRKNGCGMEFANIREYVLGDDYRTINWKASARRHTLMVNQYEAEQSQQVYVVIDKGRGMQHTFGGMTLLDYAVNATMQLTYLVLKQQDYAGLMTLGNTVDAHVKASRDSLQMTKVMEALYALNTNFAQTDYSELMEYDRNNVGKRSLYIIFTTFDTLADVRRQLPFLRHLASRHRVALIFFEDHDVQELAHAPKVTEQDYAVHVLAQEAISEKKLIASELRRNGIISVLTSTQLINADTLNAYLMVKNRGAI